MREIPKRRTDLQRTVWARVRKIIDQEKVVVTYNCLLRETWIAVYTHLAAEWNVNVWDLTVHTEGFAAQFEMLTWQYMDRLVKWCTYAVYNAVAEREAARKTGVDVEDGSFNLLTYMR